MLKSFCKQVRWIRALFQEKKNREKFKLFEWWLAQLAKAKYPLIYITLSLEGQRPKEVWVKSRELLVFLVLTEWFYWSKSGTMLQILVLFLIPGLFGDAGKYFSLFRILRGRGEGAGGGGWWNFSINEKWDHKHEITKGAEIYIQMDIFNDYENMAICQSTSPQWKVTDMKGAFYGRQQKGVCIQTMTCSYYATGHLH